MTPQHRLLPPDRFYWARLEPEAAGLPKRATREQLGYLFEAVLPCPIEEIHTVYTRLPGESGVIACGMTREVLEEEGEGAESLSPEALPRFLSAELDPHSLNLLVGEFEPAPLARLRRHAAIHSIAVVLACSLVITIGLVLRARDLNQHAAQLHEMRSGMYAQVLGQSQASVPAPELRMLAELRQLRQTRARPPQDAFHQGDDVAMNLAKLLSQWPDESELLHLQTEHVSITPGVMTLRGHIPTTADAQKLAERFTSIGGWKLQQPQVSSSRDQVQASLRLIAHEENAP